MSNSQSERTRSSSSLSSISWPWKAQENRAFDAASLAPASEAQNPSAETFFLSLVDARRLEVHIGRPLVSAEELSVAAARLLGVEPVAAQLFALRSLVDDSWLPPGRLVSCEGSAAWKLQLRIRCYCDLDILAKTDQAAMEYLFLQCHQHFLDGKIEEFLDESNEKILASAKGLALLDMLRVMKEKGETAEEVTKAWQKRFLPDDLFRRCTVASKVTERLRNSLLNKMATKHIREVLEERAEQYDVKSVFSLKKQYVEFLMTCAPSYICQQYSCRLGVHASLPLEKIRLNVMESEMCLELQKSREWRLFCRLSDICDVSLLVEKHACQINRISGPPLCVRCASLAEMESFVTLIDAYYRFSHRYYFNICKSLDSPSLQKLKEDRCHGPMEKEVMYEKLRGKSEGSFTLCQSTDCYDVYRIDVKDMIGNKSYIVDKTENPGRDPVFKVRGSKAASPSLSALISYYSMPHDGLLLKSCIRWTENDLVGLRLFPKFVRSTVGGLSGWDASFPACIPPARLVYPVNQVSMQGAHTRVYQASLKLSETRQVDVAVKRLHENLPMESGQKFLSNIQSFMHHSNHSTLVRCYGVILHPLSLVMEYLPLGSLLQFIVVYRKRLSLRNVLDAAAQIAKSVWWMEEQKCFYKPVKCQNIFAAEYNGETIKVKIGPVGLTEGIHWVGIGNPVVDMDDDGVNVDAWGFGTCLWELFMLGAEPLPEISQDEAESLYRNGYRLEKPSFCPEDVYRLMKRCWSAEVNQRPKFAEILRGMNEMLMKYYGDTASLTPEEVAEPSVRKESKVEFLLRVTGNCLMHNMSADMNACIERSRDRDGETAASPYDPWLIDESALRIVDRLGEGRYGEVNKALYTDPLSDEEPRLVAVKQLKQLKCDSRSVARVLDEMRSEMDIMKSLQHENIVETVGIVLDPMPLLVMEFVQNGALSSYLRSHPDLCTSQLLQFATDVASGMAYLQGKDIVHRDVAARNILISAELRAKISDFGLARFLDTGGYYLTQNYGRSIPLAWYAPEVIEFHKYSSKSDTWSFGVLLWEMFSFAAPPYFCDLASLADKLREGMRLPQPSASPSEVYEIMRGCWAFEAVNRPDFTELYKTLFDLLQQI